MPAPEDVAREHIDALLEQCGWTVQDKNAANLSASRGVAVRELSFKTGEPDYTLFVDGKAIGTVEAKPEGHSLIGVEEQREIQRLSTGNQESMRNIGQDRIRQISIVVPPLPEQQRIVAEVEHRLSVVEELETVVNANLQRAARLRQSILQRAFEGKLAQATGAETSTTPHGVATDVESHSSYGGPK